MGTALPNAASVPTLPCVRSHLFRNLTRRREDAKDSLGNPLAALEISLFVNGADFCSLILSHRIPPWRLCVSPFPSLWEPHAKPLIAVRRVGERTLHSPIHPVGALFVSFKLRNRVPRSFQPVLDKQSWSFNGIIQESAGRIVECDNAFAKGSPSDFANKKAYGSLWRSLFVKIREIRGSLS